jgi:hypothetical protein
MSPEESEAMVLALAELFEFPVPAQHLAEVAAAWRLMAPHLDRVRAADLAADLEPAALYRP